MKGVEGIEDIFGERPLDKTTTPVVHADGNEGQAGKLYLDSLAVLPAYRRQGIAQRLLIATRERAHLLHLPRVGLLVDKGNPDGEALYTKVGVVYLNDNLWGGHAMKHLVLPCQRNS